MTAPIVINGQMEDIKQIRYRRATQELEQMLEESSKLDPILAVKVRAKAANLLWLQAPDRARAIFIALWDLIEKERNKPGFPTEDARTAVLRQLYPRDARLAKQLIQGVIAKGNANDEGPLGFDKISGKGEFGRARELIDKLKDERTKKNYTQQLLKAEFKSYLALSELDKALKTALLVDDSSVRMQMLGQLAKTAQQKGNLAFSSEALREARKTSVDPARKGMHARALFMLASETAYFAGPEALLVMEDGVKQINELSELPKDKTLALNDPNSFLDSNELFAAFSRVGKNYLEEALQLSIKINNAAVRQSVRLSSIEKVLSVRPRDASGKPVTPANPSNN